MTNFEMLEANGAEEVETPHLEAETEVENTTSGIVACDLRKREPGLFFLR